MAARKSQQITNALLSKGFKYRDNDHKFLVLYVDGKQTSVRTKISHDGKEYGDDLLAQVSRQLCLKKTDLLSLIDCPMTQQHYVSILKTARHVTLDE